MNIQRLWAYFSCVASVVLMVVIVGFSVALPAGAQTNVLLPTSSNPSGGNWTRMRAGSFPDSARSAYTQCIRTAVVTEGKDKAITPTQCTLLYGLLTTPEQFPVEARCVEVLVPDVLPNGENMAFDYMNSHAKGREADVKEGVTKKLGRADKATLCSLGNGVFSYFFRGDLEISCNNVGFVFVPQIPYTPAAGTMVAKSDLVNIPEETLVVAYKAPFANCHFVAQKQVVNPGLTTYVAAIGSHKGFAPAVLSTIPMSVDTNSRLVCNN